MLRNVRFPAHLASLTAFAILLVRPLAALDPHHNVTQYSHKSWTQTPDRVLGLAFAITQTSDGRLWVGTDLGLVSFDGFAFSPWKPPSERGAAPITALAPDQKGGLWIGSRNFLSYWDGRGIEQQYQTGAGPTGPGVTSILRDHVGTIWVATAGFRSGGLCRIETTRLRCESLKAGEGIFSLFEDKRGELLIGSKNGIYRQSASGTVFYTSAKSSSRIDGIAEEADGTILVARSPDGVGRLAGGMLTDYPGLNGSVVSPRALLCDKDGSVWIGTLGHGLIHLHQGRVDRFTRVDGLSNDTVLALFEDKEGSIWVGTDGGIDQFRDFRVVTLTAREGLSSDIAESLAPSKDGGLWIGTASGLRHLQPDGQIRSYNRRDGLPSDDIGSILEDDTGVVWADSQAGLASKSEGRFHILNGPGGEKPRSISAFAIDSERNIWFSDAEIGLIRAKPGQILEIVPWSRFQDKQAWPLTKDPAGGLWLGFVQGGIAHYRAGEPVRWYDAAQGLAEGAVNDLRSTSDGSIWIATAHGLSRLKNEHIDTISAKNGLPCDSIHAFVEDREHGLWLNTPCGLLRMTSSALSAWTSQPASSVQTTVYGFSDGVRSQSGLMGYSRRAVMSRDGRLWFTVPGGVAVVNPAQMPENRIPPPVAIERILVDGKEYEPHNGIVVPPRAKEVEIDFAAYSLAEPSRNRFRYKLEGHDSEWSNASPKHEVTFSNLPPRRYRFRVAASNNDGVWNEAGTSFDFLIAPAFYQRLSFRIAAAAAGIGVLWAVYLIRMNRVRGQIRLLYEERLDERTRIARELHDTLLQNLSAFALQLDALSKTVREPESAKARLRELRLGAEDWLRETREAVSAIRRGDLQKPVFVDQLSQLGDRITAGSSTRFAMTRAEAPIALSSEIREHLLKIVEEAIWNALRHARATQIVLDLSIRRDNRLSIHIRDNGIGFEIGSESSKPGHWGLMSMRERAQAIGGTLTLSSVLGQGTTIEVSVAMKGRWKALKIARSSASAS